MLSSKAKSTKPALNPPSGTKRQSKEPNSAKVALKAKTDHKVPSEETEKAKKVTKSTGVCLSVAIAADSLHACFVTNKESQCYVPRLILIQENTLFLTQRNGLELAVVINFSLNNVHASERVSLVSGQLDS